jgi:4'-phosphopantetheinyl transferase
MDVYWLQQSEADLPATNDWLTPSERLRLDSMRFPKRRADWRLGRWTAKHAISAYLGLVLSSEMLAHIEVRASPSGAPEVYRNDGPADVSISITHRSGLAACAIASPNMTIGCDLEFIEPRSEAFLEDYFTDREQALVMRATAGERVVWSTVLWSAKESALKALKLGLRLDTRSVEVALDKITVAAPGHLLHEAKAPVPSDAALGIGGWQPLAVTQPHGLRLRGWWMSAGEFVRTIVTDPSSSRPKELPLA